MGEPIQVAFVALCKTGDRAAIGWVNRPCDELIVHLALLENGEESVSSWRISHRRTGLVVIGGGATKEESLRLSADLEPLVKWGECQRGPYETSPHGWSIEYAREAKRIVEQAVKHFFGRPKDDHE